MTLEKTLDFTDPNNWDLPPEVEIVNNKLQLKLIDDLTGVFEQTFTSDTGFIFDSDRTKIESGQCKQKEQIPLNATCYAKYTSDLNLTQSNGVATGTGSGGAAVNSGVLDLAHNDVRYVDYAALNNADNTQEGAIKFKYIPNYDNSPATNFAIFFLGTIGVDDNRIEIRHRSSDGGLILIMYDSSGVAITTSTLGVWQPTIDVEYEFELNWDLTTGATRLFINGNQHGSTNTSTATRTAAAVLRIGSDKFAALNSDFKIDDLIVFDSAQHTADYTAGYTLSETKYLEDIITMPTFSYSGQGSLQAFTDFVTTLMGAVKFNINGKYWNGAFWATSDDSYLQMNTSAEVATNLSAFLPVDNITIKFRFLSSNSGMYIDNLTLDYTGQIYSTNNPKVKPKDPLLVKGVTSFSAIMEIAGSDNIKFTQSINDIEKYYNGVSWADSDGYDHADLLSLVSSNISSLNMLNGKEYKPVIFLHSDDGSSTPSITSITFDYSFQGAFPKDPNQVLIFGYIYDSNGEPLSGINVSAELTFNSIYNQEILESMEAIITTTSSKGYWELSLTENDNMVPTSGYEFKFTGTGLNYSVKKRVRDNGTQSFSTLIDL